MYQVYILCSLLKKRYYIGHTGNLIKRLAAHNAGKTSSTKAYRPWQVIYSEDFNTKQDAYAREMKIKSYKGGRAFKTLIE